MDVKAWASKLGRDELHLRLICPKQTPKNILIANGVQVDRDDQPVKAMSLIYTAETDTVAFARDPEKGYPGGWLKKLNQVYGVYYVVNPGGDCAAKITHADHQFYEIDGDPSDPDNLAKQYDKVDRAARWIGVEPSYVIETYKSLHVYWEIERQTDLEAWSVNQKRLIALTHGDKGIHNADRLMRVPGYDHLRFEDNQIKRKPVTITAERKHSQPLTQEILASTLPDVITKEVCQYILEDGWEYYKDADSMAEIGPYLDGWDPYSKSNGWAVCQCPHHTQDGEVHSLDSLHVHIETGKFICHAGCEPKDVYRAAIKLAKSRGFVPKGGDQYLENSAVSRTIADILMSEIDPLDRLTELSNLRTHHKISVSEWKRQVERVDRGLISPEDNGFFMQMVNFGFDFRPNLLNALPFDLLQEMYREAAGNGVSVHRLIIPLLVSVAALVGSDAHVHRCPLASSVGIKDGARKDPLIAYGLSVGETSSGKSFIQNMILQGLYALQDDGLKNYQRAVKDWEAKNRTERQLNNTKPVAPVTVVNEATLSALFDLAINNVGAVLLVDEAADLISDQGKGNRSGGSSSANSILSVPKLLKLWNGRTQSTGASSSNFRMAKFSFPFLGGCQPKALPADIDQDEKGFLSRCLVDYLDTETVNRRRERKGQYSGDKDLLFELKALFGGLREGNYESKIWVSDDADRILGAYWEELEDLRVRSYYTHNGFSTSIPKLQDYLWRVAGLLTIIHMAYDNSLKPEVNAQIAKGAVEIVKYAMGQQFLAKAGNQGVLKLLIHCKRSNGEATLIEYAQAAQIVPTEAMDQISLAQDMGIVDLTLTNDIRRAIIKVNDTEFTRTKPEEISMAKVSNALLLSGEFQVEQFLQDNPEFGTDPKAFVALVQDVFDTVGVVEGQDGPGLTVLTMNPDNVELSRYTYIRPATAESIPVTNAAAWMSATDGAMDGPPSSNSQLIPEGPGDEPLFEIIPTPVDGTSGEVVDTTATPVEPEPEPEPEVKGWQFSHNYSTLAEPETYPVDNAAVIGVTEGSPRKSKTKHVVRIGNRLCIGFPKATPCSYLEWLEHVAKQLSEKPGCIQLMADIKAAHAEGKTIILFLTAELADDPDYLGLLSWLCFVISCELGEDPAAYLEQHQAEDEPEEEGEETIETEDTDVPEASAEEGLYAPKEGDEDLSNAEVIFDNLDWLDKNFATDTLDVDTEVMIPEMAHIDLGRLRTFVEGDGIEIDADTKAHILNLQDFLDKHYGISAKIYRKVVGIVRKRAPQVEDNTAEHEVPALTPDAVTGTDSGKA